jgi:hypothetical protein
MITPCIEHKQKGNQRGYGHTKYKQKTIHLHRLAYCKANGIEPDEISGLVIRHKCDNPRCINPGHLISGTQKENVMDMMERGRHNPTQGIKSGNCILSEEDVRSIRKEYIPHSRTRGTRALARKYGICSQQVSKIVNRKKWAHLGGYDEGV